MLENTRSPRRPRLRASPVAAWIAALLLSAPLMAGAVVTVRFTDVDLRDTFAGQDLRAYDYVISGGFNDGDTLTLEFPAAVYGDPITVVSGSGPTTLFASPVIPNVGSSTSGLLALTALTALPMTFQDNLRVSFVSLAGGSPGAQPFTVVNSSFATVQPTSLTVSAAAVPEPAAGALFAAGLALLAVLRRSPFSRSRSPH